MKKTFVALCVTSLLAIAAHAAEGEAKKEGDKAKKPELTAEQKALKKEMTEKYDTNKDGKLDKEERAQMSAEDKAKMEAAGLSKSKKAKGEGEAKHEENKE